LFNARFLEGSNAKSSVRPKFVEKSSAVNDRLSTDKLPSRSAGDEELARAERFGQYRERIKFLARVRLGRKLRLKLESSDVAQEVLLKGLQGMSGDRDGQHFDRSFLRYIAKNVHQVICDQAAYWSAARRDVDRERSFQQALGSDSRRALDLPNDSSSLLPIDRLAVAEEVEQLVSALDQMAVEYPDYWELVVAVKLEGRSFEEVAQEHRLTIGAAKMKTKRAMLKLVDIYRSMD
jgi:RNA polymerase sigma factor (sigma-70 family)